MQDVVGNIVPDLFQKSKLIISLDQQSEVLCNMFLLYVQVDGY